MRPQLRINVLGPVEVWRGEQRLELAPRQRALVAALTLDAGRVVSAETLRQRLWEDGGGATGTLHSHVSRVRRLLEPGGPAPTTDEVLRTRAPGYQLVSDEVSVDADEHAALLRSARQDRASDPRAARTATERAIALWRGEAYADVPHRFAAAEAARLQEQLWQAHELAAELDLALGRHGEVLASLDDLVRREPLREGLRASWITALYRCGRQAEALQAYEDGRQLLAESLGIDPGPALRRLHEQVLRQDPALDAAPPTTLTAPAAPDPAASWEVDPAGIGRAALVLPPTSLVGRDALLAELEDLVDSGARLLTLTGTGGVGKSRLAVTLAHRLADRFEGGTVLVPLATLLDPRLVLATVARAFGTVLSDAPDGREALAALVGDRPVLLVVDNLEHLLDAAPDLAWLVAACPRLVVVATSRAPLRVSGEVERLVDPLVTGDDPGRRVPGPGALPAAEESPAVTLFVQRARSVARGFRLTEDNAADVLEVCRRLGGIPLALELAAARLRIFTPADLLARLDEALASGPRDLPPRQRTMQATLDWSYRLLDDEARGLFRRLSVFSGGWTLPTLVDVEGTDVTTPLETLVEHSLVSVQWSEDGARYSMLEPTVQHARRLVGTDELRRAAAAHAAAYLRLVERASAGLLVGEQLDWLEVLDYEHANVLSALDAAEIVDDHETAGRLVWGMWLYWWLRSYASLGRRAATVVVEAGGLSPLTSVRARMTRSALAFAQGDLSAAEASYVETLAAARAHDDPEGVALATAGLGIVALAGADLGPAEAHLRSTLAQAPALGDVGYGPWLAALGHVWLGTVLFETARREEALDHFRRGLDLARRTGDRLAAFTSLWNLARAEADHDVAAARRHLEDGIALSREVADVSNLSYLLDALVVLEARPSGEPSDPDRAATLLGAAQALREAAGLRAIGYYLPDEPARDAVAERARATLGTTAYAAAVARGRTLPADRAVDLALQGPA